MIVVFHLFWWKHVQIIEGSKDERRQFSIIGYKNDILWFLSAFPYGWTKEETKVDIVSKSNHSPNYNVPI